MKINKSTTKKAKQKIKTLHSSIFLLLYCLFILLGGSGNCCTSCSIVFCSHSFTFKCSLPKWCPTAGAWIHTGPKKNF